MAQHERHVLWPMLAVIEILLALLLVLLASQAVAGDQGPPPSRPTHAAVFDGPLAPNPNGASLFLNYTYDWVGVNGDADAAVAITVSGDGGVKATMAGQTDDEGRFRSWEGWEWDPQQPDIVPGDAVTATVGGEVRAVNPVGEIEAGMDLDADTITGTIRAEWFAPQMLSGGCWASVDGGKSIPFENVAADGGAFVCDFGGEGYDLVRGTPGVVWYDEPDGDSVYIDIEAPGLYMQVNYGQDKVEGNYEVGHTVWLTVTESDGSTVKATAELKTQEISWWGGRPGFSTDWDDTWLPARPDIEPGDYVYGLVDDGNASSVQVGTITGNLDVDTDTITGTIQANWFTDTLRGWCDVWEPGGPGESFDVDPDGGAYACDFGALHWDLQPGDQVGVQYEEPDADTVINVFEEDAPDTEIQKWVNGHDEAAAGGRMVFGMRYQNHGKATAQTIILTDTLPANTAYVADSSGVTPQLKGNEVVWELGPLAPGGRNEFQLVLSNTASPNDTLTNEAEIWTEYDGNEWNNGSSAQIHITTGQPDLYVNKHAYPNDPIPGGTFVYHINYGNNGPVPSGPAQLVDTLPEGTTIVSWESESGYNLWREVSRGDELVLEAASIPGQWGERILLRMRVDPSMQEGDTIYNEVEIETANDSDLDNNYHDRLDSVGSPRWIVLIEKHFSWGSLVPGGEIGYNLHFRNVGNVAVPITVTDYLPDDASFVEAERWRQNINTPFPPDHQDDDKVVWDLGIMEPDEWYNLNLRLEIDDGATPGNTLENCATISMTISDPEGYDAFPMDNRACTIDPINTVGPNLRVWKEGRWQDDDRIRYELSFENIGTTNLRDVLITDTYPDNTTLANWWPDYHRQVTATHNAAQHQIVFWVEEIHRGDSGRINLEVDLDSGLVGEQGLVFTNTATAPIEGDIHPADNTGQASAGSGPDLFAKKWVEEGELRAGEHITFTVLCRNENPWPWRMSDETMARLTDRMPTGMTYAAAYWPDGTANVPLVGEPGDDVVIWDMGHLEGHEAQWFYLVTDLDDNLFPGSVLLNRLEIEGRPSTDTDPFPGNNTFVYPVVLEGKQIHLPLVLRNTTP